MRVLYVNHTAEVSGGERSLLALLAALGARVQPCVATPPGPLQEAVEQLGVPGGRSPARRGASGCTRCTRRSRWRR